MHSLRFPESALAHALLDGKHGVEIGESAHNAFGLNTINVDCHGAMDTIYKLEEVKLCKQAAKVDVVAPGDRLPFPSSSYDFVIASHALEHFWNPIAALREWLRVVKPRGYVFLIVPHRDRTFDKGRELTTIAELLDRDSGKTPTVTHDAHHSVWTTETFVTQIGLLCVDLGCEITHTQDEDDKVGNGFTVVLRKL